MPAPEDLTTLLSAFANGDTGAAEQLMPLVYTELRGIAHRRRWSWIGPDAPDTTSLVHEAYLHLVDRKGVPWENRAHFFYFASVAMRNILVDHAKLLRRAKRGGGLMQVELADHLIVSRQRSLELLALDEALDLLESQENRLAKIVECRFFGGLTVEETAEALEISPATVKRGWDTSRAWLYQHLHGRSCDESGPPG